MPLFPHLLDDLGPRRSASDDRFGRATVNHFCAARRGSLPLNDVDSRRHYGRLNGGWGIFLVPRPRWREQGLSDHVACLPVDIEIRLVATDLRIARSDRVDVEAGEGYPLGIREDVLVFLPDDRLLLGKERLTPGFGNGGMDDQVRVYLWLWRRHAGKQPGRVFRQGRRGRVLTAELDFPHHPADLIRIDQRGSRSGLDGGGRLHRRLPILVQRRVGDHSQAREFGILLIGDLELAPLH